jgi:Tol biopolymer transport system component
VYTNLDGIGALGMIDDRLIYADALGELLAVKFDPKEMRVSGPPVTLNPRVAYFTTGTAVALSERGTLVYRTEWASTQARLELVDTTGPVRSIPGAFNANGTPRFSPSGRSIVLGLGTQGVHGRRMGVAFTDLWEVDVATGEPTRLTSGVAATAPLWSADGTRVFYQTELGGKQQQWSVPISGSAPPSRAFDYGAVPFNASATPDGKAIVTAISGEAGAALVRGWLDGTGRFDTLVTMARDGIRPQDPRVSPDGRWVAFIDRSPSDVWIRSLSGTTLLQVSTRSTDGNPVAWSPDSRRLYYATTDGLHVIELETTPSLRVTKRRIVGRFPAVTDYDLAPDGRTFVVVNPIRSSSDVVVVVNWAAEARRAWNAESAVVPP